MNEPSLQRRYVYHQLMHRWGRADDIVVFDSALASGPPAFPSMEIAIWRAGDETDVTVFNTLGMSELRMRGAEHSVELNLGIRGPLDPATEGPLAAFLANITEYPFANGVKIDWWERLANVPVIPAHPGCHQLLFAPSFGEDEFSWLQTPAEPVKLLYVIPITPRENHILASHGREAFMSYLDEEEIDLFSPRTDASGG
ncbi:MAG: suppressor of fused domain protein [Thermoanaerobaculia bacterium]|nr:suppressor of fused domain protein [Thermoanaerobaculia bacterium]